MGWTSTRALEIFDEFRGYRGSYQIASAYALEALLGEIERGRPRRVLELGPGIGATTRALVSGLDRCLGSGMWEILAVEENEFCRGELRTNLGADADRVQVVDDLADVPEGARFDLVLIDGPGSLRGRTGWLSDRAVVFVENLREPQRRDLDEILPAPWTSRSSWPVLTTENLGGYHVYQLRPTAAERISFGLRGRGQQAAGTVRPWVRRGLTKARFTSALDWFARRADRGRISEAEYRDAGVMHEGD